MRVWVLLALVAGGAWAAYQFLAKPKADDKNAQTAGIRTIPVLELVRAQASSPRSCGEGDLAR